VAAQVTEDHGYLDAVVTGGGRSLFNFEVIFAFRELAGLFLLCL
jgi:hypothetical protein